MLGRHGAFDPKTHRTACPGNEFFKRKIGGLIDEEVIRGGKKAAIFYELVLCDLQLLEMIERNPFTASTARLTPDQIKLLVDKIRDANANLARRMQTELDCGIPLTGEITELFDWGFEEKVAGVNARNPRTILNVVEEQNISHVFAQHRLDRDYSILTSSLLELSGDDTLTLYADYLLEQAKAAIARDRGIVKLIEKFAEIHPDRVLIVVRGGYHEGLTKMLDGKRFDVTPITDRSLNTFAKDIIIELLRGVLTSARLRDFALLDLLRMTILKRAMIEQGMELIEASDFARDAVLQENPATAAKLGLIR